MVSEIQSVEITIQSVVYDNENYKQLMREEIERITLRAILVHSITELHPALSQTTEYSLGNQSQITHTPTTKK